MQIDVVKSVMYEIKEIVLTSGTGVLEFKIQYCTVCICICMLCVCVCTCVCVCLKEHLSWLCTWLIREATMAMWHDLFKKCVWLVVINKRTLHVEHDTRCRLLFYSEYKNNSEHIMWWNCTTMCITQCIGLKKTFWLCWNK